MTCGVTRCKERGLWDVAHGNKRRRKENGGGEVAEWGLPGATGARLERAGKSPERGDEGRPGGSLCEAGGSFP